MSLTQGFRVDPDGKSYRGYQQDHQYEHDLGLMVLPVASRTSGHRVIRLHGGYALRRVTWKASRVGVPPMIPAAADTDGDTILRSTVVPSLPVPDQANGTYSWAVSGEYLYVQNLPRVAGVNAFPAGQHPYLVSPQVQLATGLVENLRDAIGQSTRKEDTLTEGVFPSLSVRSDGSLVWPFTALPAFMTSTHIIGG